MPERSDVVIVGAGPYGLSLAAHLRAANVEFRIFGRPMEAWRSHMPEGMLLKSDGFASNIDAPGNAYPLARFCQERGLAYDDRRIAVDLKTFVDYGLAFTERYVPNLEDTYVASLARDAGGFVLRTREW